MAFEERWSIRLHDFLNMRSFKRKYFKDKYKKLWFFLKIRNPHIFKYVSVDFPEEIRKIRTFENPRNVTCGFTSMNATALSSSWINLHGIVPSRSLENIVGPETLFFLIKFDHFYNSSQQGRSEGRGTGCPPPHICRIRFLINNIKRS